MTRKYNILYTIQIYYSFYLTKLYYYGHTKGKNRSWIKIERGKC